MPTLDENKKLWDGNYQWPNKGAEWSAGWGGATMQWYGSILPRIYSHIPTDSILEIACGYGRWTQFLKGMCQNLVVVDLSNECIKASRQRFSECSHIKYHVNDGKSLNMIPDDSADFVFSFDSLVHADISVVGSYISQLHRILKKEGAAFIHHSNLGEYQPTYSKIRKIPGLRKLLILLGILEKNLHWRDPGVSAKAVEKLCEKYGLKCISQEMVTWGTKSALIDCLSTIVRSDSSLVRDNMVLRNSGFMQEANYLHRLSYLYATGKK